MKLCSWDSHKHCHTEFLENIHKFYDRNGRTFEILIYLKLGLWFLKKVDDIDTF